MKVLMVNGSRRENGCTYTALTIIKEVLEKEGIECEIFQAGKAFLEGRMNEAVKEAAEKMSEADGLVVGSPVYYASPSGELIAFLDRLWPAAGADLAFKPAVGIASARRAGTTASIDVINKYFMFSQMPVVSSNYWNMVHGSSPEDVLKDSEGIQIMTNIGKNMAWLLKSIEAGKKAGIEKPESEKKILTNFIR